MCQARRWSELWPSNFIFRLRRITKNNATHGPSRDQEQPVFWSTRRKLLHSQSHLHYALIVFLFANCSLSLPIQLLSFLSDKWLPDNLCLCVCLPDPTFPQPVSSAYLDGLDFSHLGSAIIPPKTTVCSGRRRLNSCTACAGEDWNGRRLQAR